jgi:hypothetical protein
LHGTVHTIHGDFTGFIQWNREQGLVSDTLDVGDRGTMPFTEIRSIARRSSDSALVTLDDGSEIVISNTRQVGQHNRGMYVDDERYGRVLISWGTVERVNFSPGGIGPAYDDFGPGMPLAGSVMTWSGRRLAGRLVYDLDESETTETLDAPSRGIDYIISFSQIASVEMADADAGESLHARVTLRSGEELSLERSGDLGDGNAGMLIFADSQEAPEYVPWEDVARIEFEPITDDGVRATVR